MNVPGPDVLVTYFHQYRTSAHLHQALYRSHQNHDHQRLSDAVGRRRVFFGGGGVLFGVCLEKEGEEARSKDVDLKGGGGGEGHGLLGKSVEVLMLYLSLRCPRSWDDPSGGFWW